MIKHAQSGGAPSAQCDDDVTFEDIPSDIQEKLIQNNLLEFKHMPSDIQNQIRDILLNISNDELRNLKSLDIIEAHKYFLTNPAINLLYVLQYHNFKIMFYNITRKFCLVFKNTEVLQEASQKGQSMAIYDFIRRDDRLDFNEPSSPLINRRWTLGYNGNEPLEYFFRDFLEAKRSSSAWSTYWDIVHLEYILDYSNLHNKTTFEEGYNKQFNEKVAAVLEIKTVNELTELLKNISLETKIQIGLDNSLRKYPINADFFKEISRQARKEWQSITGAPLISKGG